MKMIMFAAALALGGAALAQTAEDSTETAREMQPSGETVSDPSQATGPEGVTQQGTDPDGTAAAPAGTNMGVQGAPNAAGQAMVDPDQSAAFTTRAAIQDYPPCSRTVTDGCIQTYERGVRRPR